jgi:hypothetical protein
MSSQEARSTPALRTTEGLPEWGSASSVTLPPSDSTSLRVPSVDPSSQMSTSSTTGPCAHALSMALRMNASPL